MKPITSTIDVPSIGMEEEFELIEIKNEILSKRYMEEVTKIIRKFSDVTKVTAQSMGTVFQEIEREIWLTALQDADITIISKVKQGVSRRAAIILAEDIDVHAVENVNDIEIAQKQVFEVVLRLAWAEEIQIKGLEIPVSHY